MVTTSDHLKKRKFSRALPYAFTEHGAIMAAAVLNTPRAVEVSVAVVRAFVRLRELWVSNAELARKLERLEHQLELHDDMLATHDDAIAAGAAQEATHRVYYRRRGAMSRGKIALGKVRPRRAANADRP